MSHQALKLSPCIPKESCMSSPMVLSASFELASLTLLQRAALKCRIALEQVLAQADAASAAQPPSSLVWGGAACFEALDVPAYQRRGRQIPELD